eukprot:4688048-Prymnesium_polylepis.5
MLSRMLSHRRLHRHRHCRQSKTLDRLLESRCGATSSGTERPQSWRAKSSRRSQMGIYFYHERDHWRRIAYRPAGRQGASVWRLPRAAAL